MQRSGQSRLKTNYVKMLNATTTYFNGNQTRSTVFIIWASLMAESFTRAPNWTREWDENSENGLQDEEEVATNWSNSVFVSDLNITGENSTSNNTVTTHFIYHSIVWSGSKVGFFLASLLIMVETIVGNFLVVASVLLEKKLQTPFNFYLVNLALTDLNVGLSVMTLFMVYNLYEFFPFGFKACR